MPDVTDFLIIRPGAAAKNYWLDLWRYRELFYILAWRDLAVRYKQTVIGILWAIVRPLLTVVVFTVIFGRLARFPSEGSTPYPILVFAGTLPWTLFSSSLSDASGSVINNERLISKIYFPRLIIPAATTVTALVDFSINFLMMVVLMAWFHFWPSWHVLVLPVFVLLALLASLGPGLWLTALNVKYRDFRYVIPFAVQAGLYVSPVGFSSSIVPERWQLLYSLNPLVGIIDGFRWCLLGGNSPMRWPALLVSLFSVAVFLWLGLRTFRNMERSFADVI